MVRGNSTYDIFRVYVMNVPKKYTHIFLQLDT